MKGSAMSAEQKRKLVLVLIIAIIKECCFWIWQEQDLLNTILKLAAGVAVFLVCLYPLRRPASKKQTLVLAAAIFFIIADLVIKWQFLISGALFFLGHLLLVIRFWIHRKPGKKGILIWAVLTVIEAPLMILLLTKHEFSFAVGCLGAVYGSLLLFMAVCAVYQERMITAAAFLFLFSDLFLALHKAFTALQWMHAPSILLFYLSLGMFLLFGAGHRDQKIV